MTNTGKAYEALTEKVFRRLLDQQGFCANVRRDVSIPGKSGVSHQVDVCFDFIAGPTRFLGIVQCKDWSSAVEQEMVLAFQAVLNDIPGQPRGIMVARSGFQSGARTLAGHHGIELYELRPPKDEDWVGLTRTIRIEYEIQCPHFRNVTPCLDEKWVHAECERLGITGRFQIRGFQPAESVPTPGGGLCDIRKPLVAALPPDALEWTPIRVEFPDGLMFRVMDGPLPAVRVRAVTAEGKFTFSHRVATASLDHLVAYCFRDVLKGTSRLLTQYGCPA